MLVIEGKEFEFATQEGDYLSSIYFCNSTIDHFYVALCRDHDSENDDYQIYIESDNQIWSTFDGVAGCWVSNEEFILKFDEAAALKLGGIANIKVLLNLSQEQRDDFYSALQAIFHGKSMLNIPNE